MSVSIQSASSSHAASSSSSDNEYEVSHDFSDEQIKDLTLIRGEFLTSRKNLRRWGGEPWKVVAELIRTAFAPDHLVPIPENSTRIVHKERNKGDEDWIKEDVLIYRIVKSANSLSKVLRAYIKKNKTKHGLILSVTNDCWQYCINWLIGVIKEDYSGIKYPGHPSVLIGKISSAFYADVRQISDVPPSERLVIPSYQTVDFFVYNFLKPVIETTSLFSTNKRKRKAEPSGPNKRTKFEDSESSASSSSSSSSVSSSSSSQAVSSAPLSSYSASAAPQLPPMSLSSSSPLAPHVTGDGLIPAFR